MHTNIITNTYTSLCFHPKMTFQSLIIDLSLDGSLATFVTTTGSCSLPNTVQNRYTYLQDLGNLSAILSLQSPPSTPAITTSPFFNLATTPSTMSTDFGHLAFSYSSPATWNSIPISIKNCSSLYSFKRHLIAQLTNN